MFSCFVGFLNMFTSKITFNHSFCGRLELGFIFFFNQTYTRKAN